MQAAPPVRRRPQSPWSWVWRLLAYRLASLPVVLLSAAVIALLLASVVLSITVLGVVLLVLTLQAARWVVQLDSWLMRSVLGEVWRWPGDIGPDRRGWARLWRRLADPRGWAACGVVLVKIPLGLASLYLPTFMFVVSFDTLTGGQPEGPDQAVGPWTVVGSAVVVLAAPAVLLGLTALEVQVARALARLTTRQAERAVLLEHQRADLLTQASTARRGLERDLHDGTQARLTALVLVLDLARNSPGLESGAPAAKLVDEAHAATLATIAELRTIVNGLSPPALNAGLAPALRDAVSTSGRVVTLDLVEPFTEPDDPIALIAYYCVAELLNNATRHADAGSVRVVVRTDRRTLNLVVSDDGSGGADPGGGSGLRGLQDRIATVDGSMSIDSRPGRGTAVAVTLPLRM